MKPQLLLNLTATLLLTITLAACSSEATLDMTTKATQDETLEAVLASDKLTDKQRTDIKASVEMARWAYESTKGSENEANILKLFDEVYQGKTGIQILEAASKAK